MPTYQKTPQFEHGIQGSTGLLVANLGTPDAPTSASVRRFLRQFLSDPRVIEYPRILWWLVLNLVILVIRPSRSAAAYRKIWTDAGSPLLVHSQEIVEKLSKQVQAEALHIELAMTYGDPSIDDAIDKMLASGVTRILVLPLYPQYSGASTASVFDAVAKKLSRLRWVPELQFINCYHDHPDYISALADSIRQDRRQNGTGNKLMMSFHGVPKDTLENGDPYFCQCQKTGRLLAEELGLADDEWVLTFQSRVGREEWLKPYTDETVKQLASDGLQRLDVVCPGFAADCLETLEEIAMQNAELFANNGGGELHYIPALNARDEHVSMLAALTRQRLASWSEMPSRDGTSQRAKAMGAAL